MCAIMICRKHGIQERGHHESGNCGSNCGFCHWCLLWDSSLNIDFLTYNKRWGKAQRAELNNMICKIPKSDSKDLWICNSLGTVHGAITDLFLMHEWEKNNDKFNWTVLLSRFLFQSSIQEMLLRWSKPLCSQAVVLHKGSKFKYTFND